GCGPSGRDSLAFSMRNGLISQSLFVPKKASIALSLYVSIFQDLLFAICIWSTRYERVSRPVRRRPDVDLCVLNLTRVTEPPKLRILGMGRKAQKNDSLPGSLDMLILQTLSLRDLHGYGIVQFIQQSSENELLVEEGSLYPALQRLEL